MEPIGPKPEICGDPTIWPGKGGPGHGAGPGLPDSLPLPCLCLAKASGTYGPFIQSPWVSSGLNWARLGLRTVMDRGTAPCQLLPPPRVLPAGAAAPLTLEDRSDFFFITATARHPQSHQATASWAGCPCLNSKPQNYSSDGINMIRSRGLQRMILL